MHGFAFVIEIFWKKGRERERERKKKFLPEFAAESFIYRQVSEPRRFCKAAVFNGLPLITRLGASPVGGNRPLHYNSIQYAFALA